MIEFTLTASIWFIALIFISLYFKSFFLSLLTGIDIAYTALSYAQTDIPGCLLLIGFASVMVGYAMAFSDYSFGRHKE